MQRMALCWSSPLLFHRNTGDSSKFFEHPAEDSPEQIRRTTNKRVEIKPETNGIPAEKPQEVLRYSALIHNDLYSEAYTGRRTFLCAIQRFLPHHAGARQNHHRHNYRATRTHWRQNAEQSRYVAPTFPLKYPPKRYGAPHFYKGNTGIRH